MTEKQRQLVTDNENLVYSIVNKIIHRVHKPNVSRNDMIQEGFVGLCQAAMRYDETRGNKFSTYACAYIMGKIQTLMAHSGVIAPLRIGTKNVDVPTVSLNYLTVSPVNNHGNKKLSYEERISDEDSSMSIEQVECAITLQQMLSQLNDVQKSIVQYLYVGYKQSEIAQMLNMTRSQVNKQIRAIGCQLNKDIDVR